VDVSRHHGDAGSGVPAAKPAGADRVPGAMEANNLIRHTHGQTGPGDRPADGQDAAEPATKTFRDLGIPEQICAALETAGVTVPFPIQALALPIALDGHDVIGQARTGTGKTFAFGIALLGRLLSGARPARAAPRSLVVVPTRELALQVADDLRLAARRTDISVVTVYGGRAYEPQIDALTGADLVVGTPGRLLDLERQGHLRLGSVQALVLDEADKMLDLGFLPDVERILARTPRQRQTMLFSATMPGEIVTLARRHLSRPIHVRAEGHDEPSLVPSTAQHVFRTHRLDKTEILARVLQAEGRGLTMVFCRTKRTADQLAAGLSARGFAVAAVHGDLGQAQRERAMRAFRSGKIDVLVATDVAARGLDVDDVTHVVNYECPEDEKAYLHRIGRTGRAGRAGVAVTFVDWSDLRRWKLISDALGLGSPEPAETYSTSEHLYRALGIPRAAGGTLPSARRLRPGLDAEELEDIGETGSAGRPGSAGQPGSSGRAGRSARPRNQARPAALAARAALAGRGSAGGQGDRERSPRGLADGHQKPRGSTRSARYRRRSRAGTTIERGKDSDPGR
jgi:superfamily II DNA/RNA helicase